jgi:hypothetical protein
LIAVSSPRMKRSTARRSPRIFRITKATSRITTSATSAAIGVSANSRPAKAMRTSPGVSMIHSTPKAMAAAKATNRMILSTDHNMTA